MMPSATKASLDKAWLKIGSQVPRIWLPRIISKSLYLHTTSFVAWHSNYPNLFKTNAGLGEVRPVIPVIDITGFHKLDKVCCGFRRIIVRDLFVSASSTLYASLCLWLFMTSCSDQMFSLQHFRQNATARYSSVAFIACTGEFAGWWAPLVVHSKSTHEK